MPNLPVHELVAGRNKNVIHVMLQHADPQFGTYAPWAVTAAFYAAVHLVEGIFYLDGKRHSHDHKERNDCLRNTNIYAKIWKHYRPLYEMSMLARYLTDCHDDGVDAYFSHYFVSCENIQSQVCDHHLSQIQKIFDERKRMAAKQ